MSIRPPVKTTIFIATPLEPDCVARIHAVDPNRLEVIYDPALLPEIRYTADHKGKPLVHQGEQLRRWQAGLRQAEILWDFPPFNADGSNDIALAGKLRWVQATSTGVGRLIEQLGLQHTDVIVTTARGVHAGPLAEFVFMALLAHFRGLRHLDAEQRARRWVRYCGEEIAGRTLVTIGAGDLARGVARIARALDMRIIAIARRPQKSRAHAALFDAIHPPEDLHRVLAGADAVVVAVPHTSETENLIDANAFAAMRPGCAFVNIGRGQVVDEAALIRSLARGHLGFAALDVAAVEPLPPESPLWEMPNVLISPHSASTVTSENRKITEIFCDNLRCYLDGRLADMKNVLDKERLY
jgi:phosphoglycerate dehydrogenase-like enzyme